MLQPKNQAENINNECSIEFDNRSTNSFPARVPEHEGSPPLTFPFNAMPIHLRPRSRFYANIPAP